MGKQAFSRFSVVPPGTGICHQVNLEYLGKAVWSELQDGEWIAYPDTLVGTDSHTMINGLGVLGWGVGDRSRSRNVRSAGFHAYPGRSGL